MTENCTGFQHDNDFTVTNEEGSWIGWNIDDRKTLKKQIFISKYLWDWGNIWRTNLQHTMSKDRPKVLLDTDGLGGHLSLGPHGDILKPGHDASGKIPRWPLRCLLLP